MKSDEEEQTGESRLMKKPTISEQPKERDFDEFDDGQILTAQPLSASYTVSCVTNNYDNENRRIELNSVKHSDVQNKRSRSTDLAHNGMNDKFSDGGNVHNSQVNNRNNRNSNVSIVRFEESWHDSPGRKTEYKVREAPGMTTQSIRDDSRVFKRAEIQKVINGDSKGHQDQISDQHSKPGIKSDKLPKDKVLGGKPIGQKDAMVKENLTYRNRDLSSSRLDKSTRLSRVDRGHPQSRSEMKQTDEPKPLGLRQLIKIHEIQIAEVAKSAASLKRPLPGKAQEGRLVRVKIVPEIEAKPTHVKQNAAKVSFAGNKPTSSGLSSRKLPSVEASNIVDSRSKVIESSYVVETRTKVVELGNFQNSARVIQAEATLKPKRHTVELRTKPLVEEDQKWKRHTAIGLVGFEHERQEVPHREWSPVEKDSNLFADVEVEYAPATNKPEKQLVDEQTEKCDVTQINISPAKNTWNEAWKIADEEKLVLPDDESEVPPERPPLPDNFYSSTEEMLMRPFTSVHKNDFENNNQNLDLKPKTDNLPRVEFQPSIEYVGTADNSPTTDYFPIIENKQSMRNLSMGNINYEANVEYVSQNDFALNTAFRSKADFEPDVEYRKKSPSIEHTHPIHALSTSLPAIHVSSAIEQNDVETLFGKNSKEKDHVLGKTRTTREMYEERLARINLVPLDLSERHLTNQVTSLGSSLESFAWDKSCNVHNLNKRDHVDKLKSYMKQIKVLTEQKEELEKKFERERRDWKKKYEEQQKVANAYQKLEDRYRRQVQELQEALRLCKCTDVETRKALFRGQSW